MNPFIWLWHKLVTRHRFLFTSVTGNMAQGFDVVEQCSCGLTKEHHEGGIPKYQG